MSLPQKDVYRFGVISDTHGCLPHRALRVFAGMDAILHAGDIGSQDILYTLARVAPVLAVRGNMDAGCWADDLADYELLLAGDHRIHLIHDRLRLHLDPASPNSLAVVNGHTHRSWVGKKNGILYLNPGSAGAPRWGERPCVARMQVEAGEAAVEIIPVAE